MNLLGSLFSCAKRRKSEDELRVEAMHRFHEQNAQRVFAEAVKRGDKPTVYKGEANGSFTVEYEKDGGE